MIMITIPINSLSIHNHSDSKFIPLTYIHKKLLLPSLNQSKPNFTTPFTNNNLLTPQSTTQEITLSNQLNNPLTTISLPSFDHPPTNQNVDVSYYILLTFCSYTAANTRTTTYRTFLSLTGLLSPLLHNCLSHLQIMLLHYWKVT